MASVSGPGTQQASIADVVMGNTCDHEPDTVVLDSYMSTCVCSLLMASVSGPDNVVMGNTCDHESRTELDSHANMIVCGKHVSVLANTGQTAHVRAFSPDLPASDIPIVDCAFLYENPQDGMKYILLAMGALYVPSAEHNLVPPFIMREAGIEVDEKPKIQVKEPTRENHSVYFPGVGLRIPLQLKGTFSYFPTRMPTYEELTDETIPALYVTPSSKWDPASSHYGENEANMIDMDGDVVEPAHRPRQFILSEIAEPNEAMLQSVHVCAAESQFLNRLSELAEGEELKGTMLPDELNDDKLLHQINPTLISSTLASNLLERDRLANVMVTLGVTNGCDDSFLFPDMCSGEADLVRVQSNEINNIVASDLRMVTRRGVTPKHLANIWKISLPDAERTVEVTSQRVVRPIDPTLHRHFPTNDRMLRYRRIDDYFFMDTFFATNRDGLGKTTRGNTCMQLFVTDKGFIFVIPMKSKREVPQALKVFAKMVGAPDAIVCDMSGEQTSREVKQFCNLIGTKLKLLEQGTPWTNRAELYIGLLKEAVRKDMKSSGSPIRLWDYCAERRARIMNLTAGTLFQQNGQTPYFHVFHEEGDISNLCQYDWYEWVYYKEDTAFPFPREALGRCLGPATGTDEAGNEMCQWILNGSGRVIPRRTVRPLNPSEITSDDHRKKCDEFDAKINLKLGPPVDVKPDETPAAMEPYEDDEEYPLLIPEVLDDADEREAYQQPLYDALINTELMLPKDGEFHSARVLRRTVDDDGVVRGHYSPNPIHNTILYDVEFPDGAVVEYSANTIAENLLNQVDDEGFTKLSFKSITGHRRDDHAVATDDMYYVDKRGIKRARKTTAGWKLRIKWADNTEQWVTLALMKESNPVEVAEYAVANKLDKEPAFAWWVPYTIKKKASIISAVQARRMRRTTHKYGVELPTSVKHAYELDKKNGNALWRNAIRKEMSNNRPAFNIRAEGEKPPVGYSKVQGHLIFDVKMSLERKARWVLDGHRTPDIVDICTYAGVVSRDSVRIALTYASLNSLSVWAADIRNAYIQAPSSRKDYIICGPEFGLENEGRVATIERALYGGKSAGRDFRNHLRDCMNHLKFRPCLADPDVWMREAVTNGMNHWEYVLLYTDDCLCVSSRGEDILRNEIGKYFQLKEESIGPPNIYLGGTMRQVTLENGTSCWAFGSSKYVQAMVKNVEQDLEKKGLKLPRKMRQPITNGYRPEVDVSPELDSNEASKFQSLIGILRWIVELGRVDITCEVSMLSSHLALPREGHLQQVYNIFAYLKHHHNSEMVFDPSIPNVDTSVFKREDWSTSEHAFAGQEEVPPDMPEPRGHGFMMRAFVDADHATDSMTRKSRTGFIVYLNNAPIYWLSKKQTSVETSSFGSEFIAMKLCCEYIRGLRYKLRMMGILVDGPTYVFGDNQSVLANTTIPSSTLKKKSHSIAYHFVREGVSRDEWRTAYVNTHLNIADLLTKPLASGEKRSKFVRMILYHL